MRLMSPEDDDRVIIETLEQRRMRQSNRPRLTCDLPALTVIAASSFAEKPVPERPWLVSTLIPDRTVTKLDGDGGVGKSLLALQLAVAVATGTDWIGTLPQRGAVLYLSCEDDAEEIHRRLASITAGREFNLQDLTTLHIAPLADKVAILAEPDKGNDAMVPTSLWKDVVIRIEELKPKLLVIDTQADVFGGNEIFRTHARQFMWLLRATAIKFDMAILLLSHPSLSGLNSGSGTSGSTAWNNSSRSRLYLERPKGGDEDADNNVVVLRTKKANYGRTGGKIRLRWLHGRFQLECATPVHENAAADEKADSVFIELLGEFRAHGRDVSPNRSSTYAPSLFENSARQRRVTKKGLEMAMDRLFAAGAIKTEEHGPPSKRRKRIVLNRDGEEI